MNDLDCDIDDIDEDLIDFIEGCPDIIETAIIAYLKYDGNMVIEAVTNEDDFKIETLIKLQAAVNNLVDKKQKAR